MRKKITFLSVLLVAALLLGMVPLGAFRSEAYAATTQTANDPDVSGSKTANKTALTPEDREVDITLSLPSAEYENKVDVVFVLDASTSTKNAEMDVEVRATDLFNTLDKSGIDLKVGVIRFTGYASDALNIVSKEQYKGLVEYSSNIEDYIQLAINTPTTKDYYEDGPETFPGITEDITIPGRGSNAHSGLIMADEWLSADKDVPDGNKYVIFFTDGKNYIWNNEANEPVSYYAQYSSWVRGTGWQINSDGRPVLNQSANNYIKEYNAANRKAPYTSAAGIQFKAFTFNYTTGDEKKTDYYERLYNCNDPVFKNELESTDTKYDEPAYYSGYYKNYTGVPNVGDGDTPIHVQPNNLSDAFEDPNDQKIFYYQNCYIYSPDESTFWKDIEYLKLNPYELDENGNYDITKPNMDFFLWHADGLEKGTYLTGHYWKEVIDKKYKTGVISRNNVSGSGTNLAGSFNFWITDSKNCDYGAFIKNTTDVKALFNDIEHDIQYMVNIGTVTDPIPEEFELKVPEDGSCPFTITKGGTEITPKQSESGGWLFDIPAAETTTADPVDYDVAYNEKTKVITWNINVPVENANKVQLSYTLTIKEETEANINPGYDTNGTTTLVYKSSNDGPNDPTHNYDFTVPKVTYTKPADVTINHYLEGYVPEDVTDPETDPTTNDNTSDNTSGNENPVPTEPGTTNGTSSRSSLSLVGLAVTFTSTDASAYGLYKTKTASGNVGEEFTAELLSDEELLEGYHFDEAVTKELGAKSGTITEDGLELNLYYSLNTHTVTYEYTGEYPEDVPAVPDPVDYKFGATVPAAEVPTYEGWTFNGWNGEVTTMPDEDIVVTGSWTVDPGDNGGGTPTGTTRYTVTYQYTGTVPAGAPSVPASRTYAVGASVPAASEPSMEGYTFSGWSGEVSTMPSHDVTVTGSWTADEPIDDPDTPLAPPTDDETDIDDPDTPLAPGTIDEETEIDDEETPLSPFTGDNRHTGLWAGISIASLAGIALLSKRRRKPAKH